MLVDGWGCRKFTARIGTARIRDGFVFSYVEDERGWPEREGAKSLPMVGCDTCAAVNIRASRGQRIQSIVHLWGILGNVG